MNNRETIEFRKKWIGNYKVSVGCCSCGRKDIKNPAVLCFDHLSPKHEATKNGYSKRSSAGGMFCLYGKKYSIEILIEEIAKCRVLCHNCHMALTHSKYIVDENDEKLDSLDKLKEKLLKGESSGC